MFDTHCHLDSPRFDADREQVLARARARGVDEILIPAVGPDGWEPLLSWARGRPGVHVALGIHPQLLPELDPKDDARHLQHLERLLAAGGVVAIGECGLDAATVAQVPYARQLAVLEAHLALSRRFDLPVLLHCLRAHDPLLDLLGATAGPVRGAMHSYSGSAEQVRPYLRHDLWFSFAGPLTYERAKKPIAALRAVPRDRLLLETDAPDQTPRPHQGRCEPSHVVEVAQAAATALGLELAELEALTDANARRMLRLDPPSKEGATP